MDDSKFIHIPIEEITKPKDGATVMDKRWWTVLKEGHVSVYIGTAKPDRIHGRYRIYSPQCNKQELIANRGGKGKAVYLHFAYFVDLLNSGCS